MTTQTIIFTVVDEAPALASHSLLPILQSFLKGSGIAIETKDVSLAGRIIANFPENLTKEQQIPNALVELSELIQQPEANIIKLPNISASVPQLKKAIRELQAKGYDIPDFPENPDTNAGKTLRARFAKVLGSSVNPVLREGNSDRRVAASVKQIGKKYPHKMMKEWPVDSKSRVAYMIRGDFYGSEQSLTVKKAGNVKIEYVADNDSVTVLNEKIPLIEEEVIDTAVMNIRELRQFYEEQMERAKKEGVLLSLHLKATMMKVSDPILFGHCVSIFYKDVFEKHAMLIKELAINVNNGLGELYAKIRHLPQAQQAEIEADIQAVYQGRPQLAMVDSFKGITNLHLPNNVIIDASLPVVIRDGGKMWAPDNQLHDTIAMVPDRCYATMYQALMEDCQKHGAFNPATMGNVSNVGLMAQKAEEYGSHDKTFEAPAPGTIRVVETSGNDPSPRPLTPRPLTPGPSLKGSGVPRRGIQKILLEQKVEEGDIFRMCQTKDAPIRDWVKLAVNRARATNNPAIFWLDAIRAHDAEIIAKVNQYLPNHDTQGLHIGIMPPVEAMRYSLARIRKGEDTIAVTGNVLRDYLTDLFPILELGTSAKMLSIVPLMKGGGLFETGAGGSAPKHVQQFLEEGHLRWDSLGEFSALASSFEHLGNTFQSEAAPIFAETLDQAVAEYLENGKSPSRKVHELDNRGSHFYLALYWAQALAKQNKVPDLQARFTMVARQLVKNEATIIQELQASQGQPLEIGGYFKPDPEKTAKAMRPSATFNAIVESI